MFYGIKIYRMLFVFCYLIFLICDIGASDNISLDYLDNDSTFVNTSQMSVKLSSTGMHDCHISFSNLNPKNRRKITINPGEYVEVSLKPLKKEDDYGYLSLKTDDSYQYNMEIGRIFLKGYALDERRWGIMRILDVSDHANRLIVNEELGLALARRVMRNSVAFVIMLVLPEHYEDINGERFAPGLRELLWQNFRYVNENQHEQNATNDSCCVIQ